MRILLLGANGQVGFELARSVAPLGSLVIAARGDCSAQSDRVSVDLNDLSALGTTLQRLRPEVILNAAAYTAVDQAEDDQDTAMRINAHAVEVLANHCDSTGALLVHYSTDYVFDGSASRPWREDDSPAPLGVYGRSKLAGEIAIREADCAHLILRTSWVYAARGQNFLRTMLRLGAEREHMRVVSDQFGAPTPARWIASATALILARLGKPHAVRETLHLTAAGEVSWHGFAQRIFELAAEQGILSRIPQLDPIPSDQYPTRAKRPAYSRLDNARLRERFDIVLPDWGLGVQQVLQELAGSPRLPLC